MNEHEHCTPTGCVTQWRPRKLSDGARRSVSRALAGAVGQTLPPQTRADIPRHGYLHTALAGDDSSFALSLVWVTAATLSIYVLGLISAGW